MEAGTHISIPLVYDLLLNQEIILLSKFKKFNKNELLTLIYQMKFKDFLRTNNILARTNFDPNNIKTQLDLSILVKKIFDIIYKALEKNSRYNNVIFREITKNEVYNNIALYVKTSGLEDNRECFEAFVKSFYMNNNNIPEISGTARVYVRSKFDKAILNNRLKEYFSFPFYLRERLLFIKQNPNTKELFSLASKKHNCRLALYM